MHDDRGQKTGQQSRSKEFSPTGTAMGQDQPTAPLDHLDKLELWEILEKRRHYDYHWWVVERWIFLQGGFEEYVPNIERRQWYQYLQGARWGDV